MYRFSYYIKAFKMFGKNQTKKLTLNSKNPKTTLLIILYVGES